MPYPGLIGGFTAPGQASLTEGGGVCNFTATTDPGVTNDASQGYTISSMWYNTTTSRYWTCQSNAIGAAVWLLSGVVPGVGVEPAAMLTQFGAGSSSFPEEGNIYRYISVAGQGSTTTASVVLASYLLPANSFDIVNRGLTLSGIGSFAANGNSKTINLVWNPSSATVGSAVGSGGTTIATTGAQTTSGGGWYISGNVFKAGANSQLLTSNGSIAGASHLGTSAPASATATDSGAIWVALTASTPTATNDVVANLLIVNAMN